MILLGIFLPLLAVIGYLIIAVYNMIPIRDLRRAPKLPPDGWALTSDKRPAESD
jgi:hypothetical protein